MSILEALGSAREAVWAPREPRDAGAMLATLRVEGAMLAILRVEEGGGALRKKRHPGQETTGALLHTASCRRHGGG